MIDTLIHDVILITLDPGRQVFWDGAVAIHEGEIIDVGPSESIAPKYTARKVISGKRKILLPGMINCHMHLPQVLMRGISDDVDTMTVLKDYIWKVQGNYDEEDALISLRLGLAEMIKSGTTAFLSTGLHPRYGIDRIAQTIIDSGMRGVISKHVMDISGYALDQSALHKGMWERGDDSLRQAVDMIIRWNGTGDGRLHAWFSPRSVGGVSEKLFRKVSTLAQEMGVGITTHWAEIENNRQYTMEKFGLLPVEFAESVGLAGSHVTFAHGIYFEESEIERLAASGTNICHCPVTNAKLAMGAARVTAMMQRGVNVCLGDDGMLVNNTADLFREMRTALLIQRNANGDPTYPTSAQALELATINGARGIMAEKNVGSIEIGKRADLILIDYWKPHFLPMHDPVSAVVWAANGGDVDTVMVDGKLLMENRVLLTLDEEKILTDAENVRQKILDQAKVSANHVWKLS